MLSKAHQNTLHLMLQQELRLAEELLQTLEREHQALTLGDPAQIEESVKQKTEAMVKFDQLLRQRAAWLQQQVGISDLSEMQSLVDDLETESPAATTWTQLCNTVEQLQKKNEINGATLALGQHHVRDALNLLSGRHNLGSTTYGRDGDRQLDGISSRIARV